MTPWKTFAQPCPVVVHFNNSLSSHQNGKSKLIGTCIHAGTINLWPGMGDTLYMYVILNQPQIIRSPSSYFVTLWWWFQRLAGFKLKLFVMNIFTWQNFNKVWWGLKDKYDQERLIIANKLQIYYHNDNHSNCCRYRVCVAPKGVSF